MNDQRWMNDAKHNDFLLVSGSGAQCAEVQG